jgi:hypothetical protein
LGFKLSLQNNQQTIFMIYYDLENPNCNAIRRIVMALFPDSDSVHAEDIQSRKKAQIEAYLRLTEELKNTLLMSWDIEDVRCSLGVCDGTSELVISDEQCRLALKYAHKFHDAENGINWATLNHWATAAIEGYQL